MSPGHRTLMLTAAAVALVAAGCRTAHYVVVQEDAPLYGAASGGEVIARMPRYTHADLDEPPEEGAPRVALTFDGRVGWADTTSVRVFDYLHPVLDDGADRARTIRREVRELQLADLGDGWDAGAVAAIRAERVIPGMTRTQVEVAWGWPVTVEPGALGGERWIYRESRLRALHRYVDSVNAASGCQPWPGQRDEWQQYPAWITVRVPVTIERTVQFDEDGKVKKVTVRRYLDDAGSS